MGCGCAGKGSGAAAKVASGAARISAARGVNSPGYTWPPKDWTGRRNGPEAQPRAQQPKSG